MPNTILSSLASKPALSIVSNLSGIDYGPNLSVQKVRSHLRSVTQKHKREDGTSIVDARILLPVLIEVSAFCKTLDQLQMINALLLDRESAYTVTTKGIIFKNMMADENTIRQTPDCISANPVILTFEQLLLQGGSATPQVAQAADASMLDRGIQLVQGAATTAVKSATQLASQVTLMTGL